MNFTLFYIGDREVSDVVSEYLHLSFSSVVSLVSSAPLRCSKEDKRVTSRVIVMNMLGR